MSATPVRLNDPKFPIQSVRDIQAMFAPEIMEQLRSQFDLRGTDETVGFQFGKVLMRYQSSVKNGETPPASPQTKELIRLKKAVDRALVAFEAVSTENQDCIDHEILYRDPFNPKFFFREQLSYWSKNEGSTHLVMNKLGQISHALKAVEANRKNHGWEPKYTKNRPLDQLIQDLTTDFERGHERKAHQGCYFDVRHDKYTGQYYDFIVFILGLFAPQSYHSKMALGQRIRRALAEMAP
jgi:hypothetical protein